MWNCSSRSIRSLIGLLRGVEDQRDRLRQLRPAAAFDGELLSSGLGEAVKLRFAPGVRHLPLRLQQLALFEPVERRIERALLNLEAVFGDLADALGDAVAVPRAGRGHLQHEEVERPLKQVGLVLAHRMPSLSTY